jgi:hypothetical protein
MMVAELFQGKPRVTKAKIPEGHWNVNIDNISSPFPTWERAIEVANTIAGSKTPALDMWHLYLMDWQGGDFTPASM